MFQSLIGIIDDFDGGYPPKVRERIAVSIPHRDYR